MVASKTRQTSIQLLNAYSKLKKSTRKKKMIISLYKRKITTMIILTTTAYFKILTNMMDKDKTR